MYFELISWFKVIALEFLYFMKIFRSILVVLIFMLLLSIIETIHSIDITTIVIVLSEPWTTIPDTTSAEMTKRITKLL
jgi:hypothetical protein